MHSSHPPSCPDTGGHHHMTRTTPCSRRGPLITATALPLLHQQGDCTTARLEGKLLLPPHLAVGHQAARAMRSYTHAQFHHNKTPPQLIACRHHSAGSSSSSSRVVLLLMAAKTMATDAQCVEAWARCRATACPEFHSDSAGVKPQPGAPARVSSSLPETLCL